MSTCRRKSSLGGRTKTFCTRHGGRKITAGGLRASSYGMKRCGPGCLYSAAIFRVRCQRSLAVASSSVFAHARCRMLAASATWPLHHNTLRNMSNRYGLQMVRFGARLWVEEDWKLSCIFQHLPAQASRKARETSGCWLATKREALSSPAEEAQLENTKVCWFHSKPPKVFKVGPLFCRQLPVIVDFLLPGLQQRVPGSAGQEAAPRMSNEAKKKSR